MTIRRQPPEQPSEKEMEKILEILDGKGIKYKCPMCGHVGFILAQGYFKHFLDTKLKGVALGGPSVPTVGLICSNCGFISQHAVGMLELLEK